MQPEDFLPRLAFIRYLYTRGIEQSTLPLPMAASAVLTLHDCVEMFLQLAAERLDAGSDKKTDFDKYFVLIDAVLSRSNAKLSGKASMLRLNRARVGLKHYGNLPAAADVSVFRNSVQSFFEENAPLVFGVSFENVSMVDLVQSSQAQAKLREAASLMARDSYDEALEKIALAFHYAIGDYEDTKRGGGFRSPFYFGRSLRFESAFFMDVKDRKMGTFVAKVRESIERLQVAVKILSLGIDYRRYVKFEWYAPVVTVMMDGSRHISPLPHPPTTQAECEFCFGFVIEAAVRLQDFDFELQDPNPIVPS